jgi:hypothetical protein
MIIHPSGMLPVLHTSAASLYNSLVAARCNSQCCKHHHGGTTTAALFRSRCGTVQSGVQCYSSCSIELPQTCTRCRACHQQVH